MLDKYTKAIIGAIISGLGAYQTGLLDGQMLQVEWVGVAIATFTALAGIWGVGEYNARIEAIKAETALPNVVVTDKVVQVSATEAGVSATSTDEGTLAQHRAEVAP